MKNIVKETTNPILFYTNQIGEYDNTKSYILRLINQLNDTYKDVKLVYNTSNVSYVKFDLIETSDINTEDLLNGYIALNSGTYKGELLIDTDIIYDELFNVIILNVDTDSNSLNGQTIYTEEEIPYATKEYVDNAIENIDIPDLDLSDYATIEYVDTAINNIPDVDLSGYATEEYVDTAIDNIPTVDLTEIENNIDALDTALTVTNTNVSNIQSELETKQNILPNASASTSGILTSSDWNTFNNKINNITINGTSGTNFTISSSSVIAGNGISINGSTGAIDLGGTLNKNVSIDGGFSYDLSFQAKTIGFTYLNPITLFSANPLKYALDVINQYDDRSLVDKGYVDSSIETATFQKVKYRTTANLTATYNNNASGVGATLTATTNSISPTIDGIVSAGQTVGDRILVANQSTGFQNGIYILTSKGVAGVSPWILTRAIDSDSSDKIYKKIIKVDLGVAFQSSTIINTNLTTITMGSTNITYAVHGGYVIGSGLQITNKTLTVASVPRVSLVSGVATSIIGRSANSTGAVADIASTADGQVLKRTAGALGFSALSQSDFTSTGCTVIGRSANSSGVNADIQATADGQFLKRTSGVLGFSALSQSDLLSLYICDTYNAVGTATTSFPINISTYGISNTTYKVIITPTSTLAGTTNYYVSNKTTTSFDIIFSSPVTGSVSFDWVLYK